jgi:predicted AlkP superfamily pyrophosphatase or phosphodiesterase
MNKGKKLALFTFIDAFGWEVYQRHEFMTNTIVDARRLKTTFGFSSAADPSILTGRYPDEHTHWSSFYYSPETSPFRIMKLLSFLPRSIFDRWRVRHRMSKLLAMWYRYTGYFEIYSVPFKVLPYFDYLEKRDYFVPGGILKTDTIFDYCVDQEIPYHCSNWRLSEQQCLEDVKSQIEQEQIRFAYLYLPKLDGVMHEHGTLHEQVDRKIRWLEAEISKVLELAGEHYDEVAFYVFSDHGMANVTGSVDLIPAIEQTGLKYGTDYVAMYDSTMARFWFLSDEARRQIVSVLEQVKEGYVVGDEELKAMRVYFPDHKFGELFFVMNPGILINPSYMGLKVIPGMHGFHPDDKDSYAFIASNKPIGENINSITDIRKAMEAELSDEGSISAQQAVGAAVGEEAVHVESN